MMTVGLKYIDKDDKCYGIAGMAIGIVATDGEELLAAVDLDGDEAISFTPDYYFRGNQNLSAKIAWRHILEHFKLTSAMLISNVMCRNYVHHRQALTRELQQRMHDLMNEEGLATCQLEADEVDAIYNRLMKYFHQLFSHSGVQRLAISFADTLNQRRHMTSAEILEELEPLRYL